MRKFLIKLPAPKCVCFYNGTEDQPEELIMSLSDAFSPDVDADIDMRVRMLNINYGHNKELMKACKTLNEYSRFVDTIRRYNKKLHNIERAVDMALDEMPDDFVIKKFLLAHKAEVKGMFLTEYNEEKVLAQERKEGRQEERARFISGMLMEKLPINVIAKISNLSENAIRDIAASLNITAY